jgi:predicted nucleic acid-binding protein
MSTSYSIEAEIIDIRQDIPQSGDVFFVDTNIWYWLTYSRANSPSLSQGSRPKPYQVKHYPKYLQDAIVAGATLYYCGLSLSELAHRIEATECEISQGVQFSIKRFRRECSTERTQVVTEISSAWNQVANLATILDLSIDASVTNAALSRLKTQLIDGYDLFLLEAMKKHSVTKVITDDGDYATVPGIQVFTANQPSIDKATRERKLITR